MNSCQVLPLTKISAPWNASDASGVMVPFYDLFKSDIVNLIVVKDSQQSRSLPLVDKVAMLLDRFGVSKA